MALRRPLLDNMKAFLLIRFTEHGSDASALRALGLHKYSVQRWRDRQRKNDTFPDFIGAYAAARDKAEETVLEIIKGTHIEEVLVEKSLKRYDEILSTEVQPGLGSGVIGQIRQTAESVLKGRGYLAPDTTAVLNLNIVAKEYVQEGVEFRPEWMEVEAQSSDSQSSEVPRELEPSSPEALPTPLPLALAPLHSDPPQEALPSDPEPADSPSESP